MEGKKPLTGIFGFKAMREMEKQHFKGIFGFFANYCLYREWETKLPGVYTFQDYHLF